MSNLILHVGHTRSGSTWLQKNFFINELGFEQIDEIYYDLLDLAYSHPFSYSPVTLKEKTEPLADKLRAENKIPVISREALTGAASTGGFNQKRNAEALHEAFPDAKIVITIREQTSHILSVYKYVLLTGGICGIRRFLYQGPALWMPTFKVDFFKYHYIIKYYKELFGDERVHVILLEQIIRKEKEALKELAKFCGIDPNNPRFEESDYYSGEQTSKSNLSLAARMYLNPFIRREAQNGFSYLSAGVFMKLAMPFLKLLEKFSPKFIESRINNRWRNCIDEVAKGQFAESNKELSQLLNIDLASYGYET